MSASAALQLPATATMAEASGLLRQIEAHVAGPHEGTVSIDASALQELDTSAVALLLAAQRLAVARGVTLQVQNAPAKLLELARLYGVAELVSPPAGAAESPASAT